MRRFFSFFFGVAFFISGCGEFFSSTKNDFKAPEEITESFKIRKEQHDKTLISIAVSALDKEFLMRSNAVTSGAFPHFLGTRSRIVAFIKKDGKLLLLEASDGHQYYKDIPQKLVLADFEILSEDKNYITFDFNAGMNRLMRLGDWYAQDFFGSEFEEYLHNVSTEAVNAFIENAEFGKGLLIEQVGNLSTKLPSVSLTQSFRVKYLIEPYVENQQFTSTVSTSFEHFGFIEATPRIDQKLGSSKVFATKFDLKKNITFSISANTPPEFIGAVKEGVLYWNKAFGFDAINVDMAPKGVSAPSYDYNIIQWIESPGVKFAYADAQSDPRTGEILNVQIFFPSAFVVHSKESALKILRSQKSAKSLKKNTKIFSQPSRMCEFDIVSAVRSEWTALLSDNSVSEEVFQGFVRDYVRLVIAHEVGHTLGLRHNFMGAYTTNIDANQREYLYKDFFKTQSIPTNTVLTSSVMEYQGFHDSVMTGRLMKRDGFIGSYDKMAVEQLYGVKHHAPLSFPLFCTDSHIGRYFDCVPRKYGQSFLEYAKIETKSRIDKIADILYESMLSSLKAPYPGQQIVLPEDFGLDPQPFAERVLGAQNIALESFQKNLEVLSLLRKEENRYDLDKSDRQKLQVAWLKSELQRLGGWNQIFPPITQDIVTKASERFTKLLWDKNHLEGVTFYGEPYQLTATEVSYVRKKAENFFAKLYPALVKAHLQVLSNNLEKVTDDTQVGDDGLNFSEELSSYLAPFAETVLFQVKETIQLDVILPHKVVTPAPQAAPDPSTSGNASTQPSAIPANTPSTAAAVEPPKWDTIQVSLPLFYFDTESRALAASLFRVSRNETSDFGWKEKADFEQKFKDKSTSIFQGYDISALSPEVLSKNKRTFRRWYEDQKKVLAAFERKN